MKIELGKRYVRRDGTVSGVLTGRQNYLYPFIDRARGSTYTADGKLFSRKEPDPCDLVAEYVKEDPPTVNFWEARSAAMGGGRARLSGSMSSSWFDGSDFSTYSWGPAELAASWEIEVPPALTTKFINIYGPRSWHLHDSDEQSMAHDVEPISRLEITVDSNGKLIDAKNI